MGFGLHLGWAIEVFHIFFIYQYIYYIYKNIKGAIGSQFKIDASYLSPNVNIAARLESATK